MDDVLDWLADCDHAGSEASSVGNRAVADGQLVQVQVADANMDNKQTHRAYDDGSYAPLVVYRLYIHKIARTNNR